MASLQRDTRYSKPTWRVFFYDRDKKRRSVRLDSKEASSKRTAETVASWIGKLVAASCSGEALDNQTAMWVEKLSGSLHNKLSNVGLVKKRVNKQLLEFLKDYANGRKDVDSATKLAWRNSRKRLVRFFEAEKVLRDIDEGEASDWEQYLHDYGYADATISKSIKHARQFFDDAKRRGYVSENPFKHLVAKGEENRDRQHFVERHVIEAVLEQCPDAEWRAIVALSRYGALRCPSEILKLQWSDVNWDNDSFLVHGKRTKRHPSGKRIVPLFKELRPFLEELFELAEPGNEFVIPRYRDRNNLRTQYIRIIERAGVKVWERIFHNQRASRVTELTDDHPDHVVADWTGCSPTTAMKHYLTTTKKHHQKAVGSSDPQESRGAKRGAAHERTAENGTLKKTEPSRDLQRQSLVCSGVQGGLEVPPGLLSKTTYA